MLGKNKSSFLIPALMAVSTLVFFDTVFGFTSSQEDFFKRVMLIVQRNYYREVSSEQLIDGAVHGLVQSLDPDCSYMSKDDLKELKQAGGELKPSGMEVTLDNGVVTVIAAEDDSPAEKAGIRPKDRIQKIDGELMRNMSLMEAERRLKRPAGKMMKLTIFREGWPRTKDVVVHFKNQDSKQVRSQVLQDTAYVRVAGFNENTANELKNVLDKYSAKSSIKGLVLDLRNNASRGPDKIDNAVKIAGMFLENGLVSYSEGRNKDKRTEYKVTGRPEQVNKMKMAVLINEGSAGTSEMVAGALKDHDRALIFGSKSFGNGSVQSSFPLEDGSSVKLTTALVYTPKGNVIQKTGIQPDVDLKGDNEKEIKDTIKPDNKTEARLEPDKDPWVKAAVEWIKGHSTVAQYKQEHSS